MDWETYVKFWNRAPVRIVDIRHLRVEPGERQTYRFPASGFVYIVFGKGRALLNKLEYGIEGFCLLHAGKGSFLSLQAEGESIEFYCIFYKAELPPQTGKTKRSAAAFSPAQRDYVWTPEAPIALFQLVQSMHAAWKPEVTPQMEHLHVKARFYEFIYELACQLKRQDAFSQPADVIDQVTQYIHRHYNEPISLESLARRWSYSMQHLSKQFKRRTGKSPIDFVIQVRMDKAKELLAGTGATIREIASAVGYKDVFYFNRVFKKHTGITPGQYRTEVCKDKPGSNSPWTIFNSSIGGGSLHRYINNDNHYQYCDEGEIDMYSASRSTKILTLMLCFTLLLTACSGGNSAGNRNASASAGQEIESSGKDANGAQAKDTGGTRIISTVMGEIEVPSEPKRVVVDWHLGQVLALDVMPVGVSSTLLDYGAFLKPLVSEEVEDIGRDGQVSFEKVLTLSPDLIITWDREAYESYAKIAPTVVFDSTQYDSIHEEITAMGEILNRQEKAEAWLADFDRRKEAARAKIKNVIPEGSTFTIVDYVTVPKFVMIVGNLGERGGKAVYEILGLTPAPKVKTDIIDKKESRIEISWEAVADYVGDYVITLANEDAEPPKLPATWTSLNTVANKHVYEIEMKKYFASDPLSALLQAEEIADLLTAGSTK